MPLDEHGDQVEDDERDKDDGDYNDTDRLDPFGGLSSVPPDQAGHDGELDQREKDEEDAHHHPDVQETHVAHLINNKGKREFNLSLIHI